MKVDNPLALILSPGSLSEGMTPAQMLPEMQQIEAGKVQVEHLHKLMSGDVEGWMYAKDKTDHMGKSKGILPEIIRLKTNRLMHLKGNMGFREMNDNDCIGIFREKVSAIKKLKT